jgi:hypothetical protein
MVISDDHALIASQIENAFDVLAVAIQEGRE